MVKNPPAVQETLVRFLGQEDPLEKGWPTPVFLGFPGGSAGKESACNVGDLGSILLLTQKTEETWVQSLGQEDLLEEEMATHFSNLA